MLLIPSASAAGSCPKHKIEKPGPRTSSRRIGTWPRSIIGCGIMRPQQPLRQPAGMHEKPFLESRLRLEAHLHQPIAQRRNQARGTKNKAHERGNKRILRRDEMTHPHRETDHRPGVIAPLHFVTIEQCRAELAFQHGRELPRQIGRIAQTGIHSLPGKGRHQMRRITGEKNVGAAPAISNPRLKGVDAQAIDLRVGVAAVMKRSAHAHAAPQSSPARFRRA